MSLDRRDFLTKSFAAFVAASMAVPEAFAAPQMRYKMNPYLRRLLNAIREIETGDKENEGENAVGDNGMALGPYQIWKDYWSDAVEWDPSIGGVYEDVKKKAYSEKVVLAYWSRYAPTKANYEILARIHNGGPLGYKKSATIPYWNKVKHELNHPREH